MRLAAACVTLFLASAVAADAPSRSLRPVARGQVVAGQVIPAEVFMTQQGGSSAARASAAASAAATSVVRQQAQAPAPQKERRGLFGFLRPKQRTARVEGDARRKDAARRQGAICGNSDIQGVSVGRVSGTLKGCQVIDAVRVQSVSGVALSTHAVMDCGTARALNSWVETGLRPAVKRYGGGVSGLRVVAHYACRTRNSQKGAKLSEHGKGKAIDIAGIKLQNGGEITVLTGWNDRKEGKILRKAWKSACGPFGTVLGPNSNRFHLDHFHFDTASYRSGPYCK